MEKREQVAKSTAAAEEHLAGSREGHNKGKHKLAKRLTKWHSHTVICRSEGCIQLMIFLRLPNAQLMFQSQLNVIFHDWGRPILQRDFQPVLLYECNIFWYSEGNAAYAITVDEMKDLMVLCSSQLFQQRALRCMVCLNPSNVGATFVQRTQRFLKTM